MAHALASLFRIPLSVQLVLSVLLGVALAVVAPAQAIGLSDYGQIVIKLLKVVAAPLLFLAVVDALARSAIGSLAAGKLLLISSVNAVVATIIGLSVAHLLGAGTRLRGTLDSLLAQASSVASPALATSAVPTAPGSGSVLRFIPSHILEPFMGQNVISVVATALVVGWALRAAIDASGPSTDEHAALMSLTKFVHGAVLVVQQTLAMLIRLVPLAVFFVVAEVVAKAGVAVFSMLGWFLGTVLCGMLLHSVIYYSGLLRVVGKRSPRWFFVGASDAIATALSCGSSLASLPVTLRCLRDKLRISDASSRLAACIGTNLNHDGIILYEATAAIFVAQMLGWDLSLGQQVTIAMASVAAGVGIAGVPEAGLITLPLVLAAAGIDEKTVASLVPILFTVDWLIGRWRATVNVMSDMVVACLLDAFVGPSPTRE